MATIKEASVDKRDKTPEDYLKMPYARVLTPDDETGTYTAEILEFPGCIAQGDTPEEAYSRLEGAAEGWIWAALNMGQEIPKPSDPHSYSGRIALRLPRGLHRRAAQMAERDGTSLNQFLVAAIAERVGTVSLYQSMVQDLGARLDQLTANTATRMIGSLDALAPWHRDIVPLVNPSLGNVNTWRRSDLTATITDASERLAGTPNG